LSRRLAAHVVGAGILVAGTVVLVVVGPPAVEQAAEFEEDLPEMTTGFYDLPIVGTWLEDNDAATKVEDFVAELPAQVDDETVADTADSLVGGVLTTLVVLGVAFAIMLDGETLVARVRRLIPPAQRGRADDIGRVLYQTFGNYFGGSVTVAVMMGIYVLILGLVFGVPLAPIAAMWAMITNPIPQIGGFLGGSFLTVLALSVSVPIGIVVGLLYVLYMNFENHIIQPAVIGEAVDLSPPATMMAALIGGAAAGVPGALVATPVVGATKRLYLEFRGRAAPPAEHPSFAERIRRLVRRD